MNQEEAGEILRANVENLSEPLKSAVEFALTNFFMPSAADLAKKFLASIPFEVFMSRDLRETNPKLKNKRNISRLNLQECHLNFFAAKIFFATLSMSFILFS